jgi:alpha-ketoglutaric semialdehyde dehydrogenase
MAIAEVLLDGSWRKAHAEGTFRAENPATSESLTQDFPVSTWEDCEIALNAAAKAAVAMRTFDAETLTRFLESYATRIEASAAAIVEAAHSETALPVTPRLKDVELPRTTNQLRQAAVAAREESWKRATLDLKSNIRSCYAPIGPVVVFGPNNFPLAFNGISGGDFAAAIAAGNPVIAKVHPLHPETSRLLATEALAAAEETGMPAGSVQMLYHLSNENGLRLVSDPRIGAVGFTGSRTGGMHLKRAAEAAGKPIYLEMSSLNPVIFLPGSLAEAGQALSKELVDSCLAGSGQFCTSPNLIFLFAGSDAESFVTQATQAFTERTPQPLLSASGLRGMEDGVAALEQASAHLLTGGKKQDGAGYRFANTLFHLSGSEFLANPHALQREIFGNATTIVTVKDLGELEAILEQLEGNLTGTIYSAKSGADDAIYAHVEPILRARVGRLLNDKMPTGVAVSPAMQHGGPYPATGHAGFTSVGIPASLSRFAMLQCYDGVRPERLPAILRDTISNPQTWRSIGGAWVQG